MNEHVPPNLRAIRMLEVLSDSSQPLTPTELNARLGWPKQTIHRLCQTLIEAGILESTTGVSIRDAGPAFWPPALPTGAPGLSDATRFCCRLRAIG